MSPLEKKGAFLNSRRRKIFSKCQIHLKILKYLIENRTSLTHLLPVYWHLRVHSAGPTQTRCWKPSPHELQGSAWTTNNKWFCFMFHQLLVIWTTWSMKSPNILGNYIIAWFPLTSADTQHWPLGIDSSWGCCWRPPAPSNQWNQQSGWKVRNEPTAMLHYGFWLCNKVPFPGVEVQVFPGSHSVLCEYKERPDWLTGLLPRGSLPAKHTNTIVMHGHYKWQHIHL